MVDRGEKDEKMNRGIPEACHSCVIDQAMSAAGFAGLDSEQTARVITVAWKGIQNSAKENLVVQHIVRRVADAVISELNESDDFDIYKEVKRKSNTMAMTYVPQMKERIESSENPLETAIQIAAAGNIIDFGAKQHGNIDLDKELKNIHKVGFSRFDIDSLESELKTAKKLLYICDNSGEIVFDSLLIETVQKLYPEISITAAVREKPIINDATPDDANDVGLTSIVPVISSGSLYPGTILEETTDEFRELFESTDVIISKGQGNFETLLPVQNSSLFFLLRIKCDHMAALSGVEKGNLVLMQGC